MASLDIVDPDQVNENAPDGVLLVTTIPPRLSTDPEPQGGWSECVLSAYLKRQILATKGFCKSPKPPSTAAYCIKESNAPGDWGLAMFAIRNISMGETICDERPLLVSPTNLVGQMASNLPEHSSREQLLLAGLREAEVVLQGAFVRMDPKTQAALMALRNTHKHDGSGPLMGVVRTNGFDTAMLEKGVKTVGSGVGGYGGVFKDLSRARHSCCTNTSRNFSTVSFSMKLRAVRDIEEGEEITVSYCDILAPYASRQKSLESYQIICDCKACKNPVESDRRRASFKKIGPITPGISLEGIQDDVWIQPAVKELEEMEAEGVQSQPVYQQTLHKLLNSYAAMGNEEKVKLYGEKLYKLFCSQGKGKANRKITDVNYLKTLPNWGLLKQRGLVGMSFA